MYKHIKIVLLLPLFLSFKLEHVSAMPHNQTINAFGLSVHESMKDKIYLTGKKIGCVIGNLLKFCFWTKQKKLKKPTYIQQNLVKKELQALAKNLMTPEGCTAIHESAHALLYYLNDIFIVTMTIRPTPLFEGGVRAVISDEDSEERWRRARLSVSPAGFIAERMLNPYVSEMCACTDRKNAIENAREIIDQKLCTDLYDSHADLENQIEFLLEFGKQEANRMLNQHIKALLLLANEVLSKKELKGEQIDQFLRPIYPNQPPYLR